MWKASAICGMLAAAGATMFSLSARADHSCDALGETGWSTVPSHEVVNVVDRPPYQAGGDWFVDRRKLPGIRGLRLHVEAVRAKMKYGGNKTPEHRNDIAERLTDRDAPGDRAARDHLLRRT